MDDESTPATLNVAAIQERLRAFTAEREWEPFHSPKNLAMALTAETGELLEVFQWLTEAESRSLSDADRIRAQEELADVLIYLLRLADVLGIDLSDAVDTKIEQNESKYPVSVSKGDATKASRRDEA